MATYCIGDVQGCFRSLSRLLERLSPQPEDTVCFAGDLVNRGPRSLQVLRFLRQRPHEVRAVLGNHDLWALARYYLRLPAKSKDTLEDLLKAPDAAELFDWLCTWPLVAPVADGVLVHAGLHPDWTIEKALELSREVQGWLGGGGREAYLKRLSERAEITWSEELTGLDRAVAATDILTRLRVCRPTGQPDFSFSGPPEEAPEGFSPWYTLPRRRHAGRSVVFGHWAAHGLMVTPHVVALDSGCVWGRVLSAVRLEDHAVFQIEMRD